MADTPLTLTTTMGFFYKQSLPTLRQFIALFFSNIVTTAQTQIRVDRYTKKFKNIAYVPLHGASRLMDFENGKGIMYVPPRISAKTPIGDAADGVTVGIDANAPVTSHLAQKYALIQENHSDYIWTTLVLQALEMMRTGAFTATTGEDAQAVGTFTYNRDATLNLSTYDTSVSGAYNGLKALFDALKAFNIPKGGLVALVGSNYMSALESDTDFQDYQKNTQYQVFAQTQAGQPFGGMDVVTTITRVKIPGTSHYVTLLSFDETYEDTDGSDKPMFPLNEVVMTSMNTRNTAAFAGIKIANHSTRNLDMIAGEVVTDRKLFDEPDDICLRSQSRGLMIPGNINHIGRLIATDLSAT
jgi:hypothetical protein